MAKVTRRIRGKKSDTKNRAERAGASPRLVVDIEARFPATEASRSSSFDLATAGAEIGAFVGQLELMWRQDTGKKLEPVKKCEGDCHGNGMVFVMTDAGSGMNIKDVPQSVKDSLTAAAKDLAAKQKADLQKVAKEDADKRCKEASDEDDCKCSEGDYKEINAEPSVEELWVPTGPPDAQKKQQLRKVRKLMAGSGFQYKGKCKK